MAGYVCLGLLAAIGTLCVAWSLLGWLLPRGEGMALVCIGQPDEGILSRFRWLRSMGLLHSPLFVVTEEQTNRQQYCGIEICSPGELLSRLEQERNRFDGTGNGDSSGRDQRCGISEL